MQVHLPHVACLSLALAAQGLANADHTTLLLNCYTKLKDVAKLDSFLRGAGAADGRGALPFDVETAVKARPAAAGSTPMTWFGRAAAFIARSRHAFI